MAFAIKAPIHDPQADAFVFTARKTMCGGKLITAGDTVFVFASESNGGQGLVAEALVTAAESMRLKPDVRRQVPLVSITARRTALARRPLLRGELKRFTDWQDGRPETELNFKVYRQATNKIVGLSYATAAFLKTFF